MTGFSIPFHQLDSEVEVNNTFDKLVDIGVGWLRTDLPPHIIWSQAGPENIDWTAFDRIVSRAQQEGIKLLVAVNTLPAWLGEVWNHGPETPTERNAYVDFFEQAVARYDQDAVAVWQMWNEPNWQPFWDPTPSPASYYALIQQTYTTIKPLLHPSVLLVSGGPTGTESADWFQQLYALGAGQYWDAVTIHAYQDLNSIRDNNQYFAGGAGQVAPTRQVMNQNGDTDMGIWCTEIGNPTLDPLLHGATENEQATWIVETGNQWLNQATNRGATAPLFWYSLIDQDTGEPTRGSNFGVIRTNGTHKPAYDALKNWIAGV